MFEPAVVMQKSSAAAAMAGMLKALNAFYENAGGNLENFKQ